MRLAIIALLAVFPRTLVNGQDVRIAPQENETCRYSVSSKQLSSYDKGGPFALEHFHLTRGRTELREFVWRHWHDHKSGVAEARIATVDAGTVTALYVIQADSTGRWGVDVELHRPSQPPPCSAFHADTVVRVAIRKPDEDYPSQTLGPYWPDRTVPLKFRMSESEIKDPKLYTIILMAKDKAVGDTI